MSADRPPDNSPAACAIQYILVLYTIVDGQRAADYTPAVHKVVMQTVTVYIRGECSAIVEFGGRGVRRGRGAAVYVYIFSNVVIRF